MEARTLITHSGPSFVCDEVILPDPGPDNILARTLYSGVSIGTEFAAITGKLDYGPAPLCTGYQGVGIVEHVGKYILGFRVGDRVYYLGNRHIQLTDGQKVSA